MSFGNVTLRVDGVRKTYPNGIEAVRSLSLEVRSGEVFGLVGPNGAGKTTLLKLASGLLFPESGRVTCNGTDITANPKLAARYIGLMPDPLGVYTDVTAHEYLEFFARAQEVPPGEIAKRIERAVDLLRLGPWMEEEVETLSAGWQRRLALGRVLLTDVPVLLLDEPAAGLDVSARSELLAIVRRLAETGRTLIVSSHILPELQQLADRFGIINEGRWVNVSDGQPFFSRDELLLGFKSLQWRLRCSRAAAAAEALTRGGFGPCETTDDAVVFPAADADAAAAALRLVVATGANVYEFTRRQVELTEFVLEVLDHGADATGAGPTNKGGGK